MTTHALDTHSDDRSVPKSFQYIEQLAKLFSVGFRFQDYIFINRAQSA
jgi:hypothetical protein